MANRDVVLIVWGETSALRAKSKNSADLDRLRAVVAKLAAAAISRGLGKSLHRQDAPRGDETDALADYKATEQIVDQVEAVYQDATPLPARAVLWEITENRTARPDGVPPAAAWILESGVAPSGEYLAGEGGSQRTYGLFESPKLPGETELPYISGLTGTGVPVLEPVRRWYTSPNWAIGLGGGALFFLAGFSILWTSTTFGLAYDLLTGRQAVVADKLATIVPLQLCPANVADNEARTCAKPDEDPDVRAKMAKEEAEKANKPNDEVLKAMQAARDAAEDARKKKRLALFTISGASCVNHMTDWVVAEKTARDTKGTAPASKDDYLFCLAVLNYAVTYAAKQSWFNWVLGWHIPTSPTQTVSLGTPTALMMLGVLMVLIGLGRGVNGTPLGALISPNGRYSLALAQVTFWTILILTSVTAIAIFNGGLVSEFLRYFANIPKDATPPVAYAKDIFPDIPEGIWGVLGISFGSTMLSTLMKSLKGYGAAGSEIAKEKTREIGGLGYFKAPVAGFDPTHRASIADWFLGEDDDNKNRIDISRVQMVLITAGLLVTYGNAIFAAIRNIAQYEIIAAIRSVDVLIGAMPPVGTAMTLMLAVSHATYLVAKGAEIPGTAPNR